MKHKMSTSISISKHASRNGSAKHLFFSPFRGTQLRYCTMGQSHFDYGLRTTTRGILIVQIAIQTTRAYIVCYTEIGLGAQIATLGVM